MSNHNRKLESHVVEKLESNVRFTTKKGKFCKVKSFELEESSVTDAFERDYDMPSFLGAT